MNSVIALPSVYELADKAMAETDFFAEIRGCTPRETYRAATIATNQAAEAWEEARGLPVGATVPDCIRLLTAAVLVTQADVKLRAAESDAADALEDAIDAGDVDVRGNVVPYAMYRSA